MQEQSLLCEVVLKEVSRGLFGRAYRFVAIASTPKGLVEVDSTKPLKHGYTDWEFERELAALTNRMLSSGWQALPSAVVAPGRTLPRFQRAHSAASPSKKPDPYSEIGHPELVDVLKQVFAADTKDGQRAVVATKIHRLADPEFLPTVLQVWTELMDREEAEFTHIQVLLGVLGGYVRDYLKSVSAHRLTAELFAAQMLYDRALPYLLFEERPEAEDQTLKMLSEQVLRLRGVGKSRDEWLEFRDSVSRIVNYSAMNAELRAKRNQRTSPLPEFANNVRVSLQMFEYLDRLIDLLKSGMPSEPLRDTLARAYLEVKRTPAGLATLDRVIQLLDLPTNEAVIDSLARNPIEDSGGAALLMQRIRDSVLDSEESEESDFTNLYWLLVSWWRMKNELPDSTD